MPETRARYVGNVGGRHGVGGGGADFSPEVFAGRHPRRLFLGVWAAQKTGEDLGVEDAGCIVIDEVVAVWFVCLWFPQNWVTWTAAFLAFRLFDIVKLPPASVIDEKMKNGWGVMLDDMLAALWALALLLALDAATAWTGIRFLGVF